MTAMNITLNGTPHPLTAPTLLVELLQSQGLNPAQAGFAVAVNRQLVRRTEWPTTTVQPGDAVEIVHARQGG